jgi:TonB family protein
METVSRKLSVITRLGWRVWLAVALLGPGAFASKKETEAIALLDRAKQLSDIRAEGTPAFRLKINFRIIQDGSSQEGAYSEIWASKTQWRRETTLGDFRRIEVASGRKLWRLDSATAVPEHITDILGFFGLSTPTPEMPIFLKPAGIEDQQIRGLNTRCIEASPDSRGTYALCFDKNAGTLAAELQPLRVGMRIAARDCVFSDYQKFGDRLVASAYQCYEDGHLKFQARVAAITAEPAPDPGLFRALDGAKESVNCLGPVNQGTLIDRVEPRSTLAGGIRNAIVVMRGVIGTDGNLHELKVVSSPNPEFDESALKAVQQWRYKPYTCDGEPVEVDTEVEVNFHRP